TVRNQPWDFGDLCAPASVGELLDVERELHERCPPFSKCESSLARRKRAAAGCVGREAGLRRHAVRRPPWLDRFLPNALGVRRAEGGRVRAHTVAARLCVSARAAARRRACRQTATSPRRPAAAC